MNKSEDLCSEVTARWVTVSLEGSAWGWGRLQGRGSLFLRKPTAWISVQDVDAVSLPSFRVLSSRICTWGLRSGVGDGLGSSPGRTTKLRTSFGLIHHPFPQTHTDTHRGRKMLRCWCKTIDNVMKTTWRSGDTKTKIKVEWVYTGEDVKLRKHHYKRWRVEMEKRKMRMTDEKWCFHETNTWTVTTDWLHPFHWCIYYFSSI